MKKLKAIYLCTGIVCAGVVLLSLMLGAARLSPAQLWHALFSGPTDTAGYILWYSRAPRTLACLLAGAALACSGCVLQSVLGNELASPGVIGVNAGAGLGVSMCCALGGLSGWAISVSSFAGALFSAALVAVLARKTGSSRTTVILAGVAMNSILNAFRDALTALFPETAMLSGDFRVGSFSAVSVQRLLPAGALIVIALVVLVSLTNELDVLALGEDTALSLGMNVKAMRMVFLLLAALLAGAAVSFAGLLGFVGLLVPHIARRFTGSEGRRLIPMSMLAGASLVLMCDLASRTLFMNYELPVGILMSVIGGPFFLVLLLKRRRGVGRA